MSTVGRWWPVLASLLGAACLLFLLPSVALADNCSSRGDCWATAAGAASAAVGAAVGAIGGLFGGLGGGDGEGEGGENGSDDTGLPENEDFPDPNPC